MSSTEVVFDYCVGPEQKEAEKFTTNQWRGTLGTMAWDHYTAQRKAALRFIALPLVLLGLHALLSHNVPQKYVSWSMVSVIIPLFLFRQFMKDVAYRSTAAGMVDLFQLDKWNADDKLASITTAEFKELLAEHFSDKAKKKQRMAAVDALLKTTTGLKKPLMWLSVLCLAIVLVVNCGPFFGLLFALTFACSILTTIRYFRAATPPLKKLGAITKDTDYNDEENEGLDILDPRTNEEAPAADDSEAAPATTGTTTASTPKKEKKGSKKATGKKAAAKKTASATSEASTNHSGPTDEDLLELVRTYHENPSSLTLIQKGLLTSFFGNNVPSVAGLKKILANAPSADEVTPPAAPATTGTTTSDGSALPPLPRRTPKKTAQGTPRHARRDDGSTGTPAHGTPVVQQSAPSADASSAAVWSSNSGSTNGSAAPSVPTPAPATTFSSEELDEIFMRHMNNEKLSPEEFAAIKPHLEGQGMLEEE